jgi:hypothetical protein
MAALALTHPPRKRDEELDRYINLKLAALGQPVSRSTAGSDFIEAVVSPVTKGIPSADADSH